MTHDTGEAAGAVSTTVQPATADPRPGDSVPARRDPAAAVPVTTIPDLVSIRLPAAGAYLSVLRTATAGLAARLDFTLDEIEDLRIAVDEACAMLLSQAVPGADLECGFELDANAIRVSVGVLTLDGETPSRDTFAWTVLSALAGEVDSSVGVDDRVTIHLVKRRAQGDG